LNVRTTIESTNVFTLTKRPPFVLTETLLFIVASCPLAVQTLSAGVVLETLTFLTKTVAVLSLSMSLTIAITITGDLRKTAVARPLSRNTGLRIVAPLGMGGDKAFRA
jgi:hypothetical protein